MTIGQGNIFVVNKQDQSGAPFFSNAADNGLSVDSGSGRIVLGAPLGAGAPATLLNDREILTNGFSLNLFFDDGGLSDQLFINEFEMTWTASGGTPITDIIAGQISMTGDNNTFQFVGSSAQNSFILQNSAQSLQIIGQGGFPNKIWTFLNDNVRRGDFVIQGGFQTADPGSGAGVWLLGQPTPGAVALDAANYVEVKIDGVIVKLGIVV